MVDQLATNAALDPVSGVFAALADPTRRALLARLAVDGPRKVTDLAKPFRMSLQAVSKHLKKLERAGLIRRDVQGRAHRCSMEAAPLAEASAWIEAQRRFWENRLDALETYLSAPEANEPPGESS